jgi:hypothetical protein
MTRARKTLFLCAALTVGCYANHTVGDQTSSDAGATATSLPVDEVVLEVAGKTFSVCNPIPNSWGYLGGPENSFCPGGASGGQGPEFDSLNCVSPPSTRYVVSVLFRNFDATGIQPGTSFDLSVLGHEEFLTVLLDVDAHVYCSDVGSVDGGMAASGTVVVHQFVPGTATSEPAADVELTDVEIPVVKGGGDSYRIVHARLYSH